MSEEIKSAFERAWERVEKLTATAKDDKVKELQYQPEGARLAARYLREEADFDLEGSLSSYDAKVRKYVLGGAIATFASNIILPRNERSRRDSGRALEGLLLLKRDKSRLSSLKDKVASLLVSYERDRQDAYNTLRQEFDAALRRTLRQQMGVSTSMRIDVEANPEFRQRWQELSAQLDRQYEEMLERLKGEIGKIP